MTDKPKKYDGLKERVAQLYQSIQKLRKKKDERNHLFDLLLKASEAFDEEYTRVDEKANELTFYVLGMVIGHEAGLEEDV